MMTATKTKVVWMYRAALLNDEGTDAIQIIEERFLCERGNQRKAIRMAWARAVKVFYDEEFYDNPLGTIRVEKVEFVSDDVRNLNQCPVCGGHVLEGICNSCDFGREE